MRVLRALCAISRFGTSMTHTCISIGTTGKKKEVHARFIAFLARDVLSLDKDSRLLFSGIDGKPKDVRQESVKISSPAGIVSGIVISPFALYL